MSTNDRNVYECLILSIREARKKDFLFGQGVAEARLLHERLVCCLALTSGESLSNERNWVEE